MNEIEKHITPEAAIEKCIEIGVLKKDSVAVRNFLIKKEFQFMLDMGRRPGEAIAILAKKHYREFQTISNIVYESD
jgi:hypothetical protein